MQGTRRYSTMLVMAVVLAASGGCEKTTVTSETPSGATTSTTTVTPSQATRDAVGQAGDALSDAAITAKVKAAMLVADDVKGMQIDVDTRDGVVTLSGAANDAGSMERAASLAKNVEGVKSVNNRLTIKPPADRPG